MKLPCAYLSASALRHNLGVVRQLAPNSRVLAVIKANAYGHDLVSTARALGEADALAVARLEEALILRAAGAGNRIVLLEGVFSAAEMDAAATHTLDVVVHSADQVELLRAWSGSHRFDVWAKVDTGMNRLGFRPENAREIIQRLRRLPAVSQLRLMTHLASADEREKKTTVEQLARFDAIASASGTELERSVANSAGLIAWPQARVEWVRPGIMLYGISPFASQDGTDFGLQPVMSLKTQIIAVRQVLAGESVGYGESWRTTRDARVGILAAGYGDGYPRSVPTGTPVLIAGVQVPIVGRVSMDMIAVDLTYLPQADVGTEALLWGNGLPVERIAMLANTIPYELVCGLSQRVAVEWTE